MSERLPKDRSPEPVTVDSISSDLRALGVQTGETLLVHGSLSALGWVCAGPPAVIDALQHVVSEDGNIVMPTHTSYNSDPAYWSNPPVPESWYDTIREQMPPYRPSSSPTYLMGAIPECFRSYKEVRRSGHPHVSFAAWGADAGFIVENHALDFSLGEESPLARVYDLAGDVLFLGSGHATNTSLHLAEYRANLDLSTKTDASSVLVDGECEWVHWEDIIRDEEDFPRCGEAFESEHPEAVETGIVGVGNAKLLSQPQLVDFAVEWFEAHRG